MAYSTVATDDFNRSPGVSLGANWTNVYGSGYGIVSNAAYPLSGEWAFSRWNANSFANNQYAKIKLSAVNVAGSVGIGAAVRLTDGVGGYLCIALPNDGDKYLARMTSGGGVDVMSSNGSSTIALNDVYQLDADGSLISPFRNGAADTDLTATSNSVYTAGYAGIGSYGTLSTVNGDDWEGGDITTPSDFPPAPSSWNPLFSLITQ